MYVCIYIYIYICICSVAASVTDVSCRDAGGLRLHLRCPRIARLPCASDAPFTRARASVDRYICRQI